MSNAEKYKIIGYTNPADYFPSPLVTIVEFFGRHFAVYSDTSIYLIDSHDLPSITKEESFIEEKEEKFLYNGEYCFMVDKNSIVKGNNLVILLKINELKPKLPGDIKKFIEEFTKHETDNLTKEDIITWEGMFILEDYFKEFKVFVTERKTKKGLPIKKVFVQHSTNTGFKTSYKKNLRFFNSLNDFDKKDKLIPILNSVSIIVFNRIENLSKKIDEYFHRLFFY